MRVLAIDHGEKRIGIAVSDPLGLIAQPVAALPADEFLPRLKELLAQYEGVGKIVVGLPKKMSGELGPAAQKVLEFVKALQAAVDLPVITWDERLTTAAAQKELISAGRSRRQRKGEIDRTAAALLLQSYLDSGQRSTT